MRIYHAVDNNDDDEDDDDDGDDDDADDDHDDAADTHIWPWNLILAIWYASGLGFPCLFRGVIIGFSDLQM